jgi:inorganic pyrophosphatase
MNVKAFIEIPKGSHQKYELDEETKEISLDRTLYSPVVFPFEYGFIKETKGEDGDPLDVIVLATYPTFPGCNVEVRVIGFLDMEDEAGVDHKIIAVPNDKIDPRFSHIKDVKDLPSHLKAEIKEFFEIYKKLEPNKWVKLNDFKSKEEAEKKIEAAQERA